MEAERYQTDEHRRVAVACPQCGQGYKIAARLVGRKLICRQCRNQWRAVEVDPTTLRAGRLPSKVSSNSDSANGSLSGDVPSAGSSSTSIAIDTSWAGRDLGRYHVLSILGTGGMGVVWRGHDDKLRRDVALKILNQRRKDKDQSGTLNVELFMQEARAVAKLQHPAVVSIFEVAEDHNQVFLALELMEGGTLKEYVDSKGPIPPRDLFAMMVGPAKALSLAHRKKIIHRDIKPGNLMFDDHGHLKLMDFGLADVADEVASTKLRGRAVGSLGWVAPETARGKGTTQASDIYSMGLVMLYALNGKAWLQADSRSKLIAIHQNPPTPSFGGIAGLTPAATAMLHKCLAVEQSQRYASADDLARDLQLCADEDPLHEVRRKRSNFWLATAASLVGAVITGAGLLAYFLYFESQSEKTGQPITRAAAVSPAPNAGKAKTPASPGKRSAGNVASIPDDGQR